MTDLFGARRVAAVGIIAYPFSFVVLAMQGAFVYYAVTVLQVVFVLRRFAASCRACKVMA